MKKTLLKEYARLIVRCGVNVQKGQEVMVYAGLDQPEFVKLVVEEAYKAKAKEVIGKLNELKRVNEEKIKQASLKSQYGDNTIVDTFTPTDNAVFTPVYEGEYIDAVDYNTTSYDLSIY